MKKKSKTEKKWGRKQVFILEASPYSQQCLVVLNGQFSDAVKYYKKANNPLCDENLKHIEEELGRDKDSYQDIHKLNTGSAQTYTELPHGYVMVISHQDSWIKSVESVVHECLHLTHYILRRAGLTLCKESEEAYTYLQQKLVTDILFKMY